MFLLEQMLDFCWNNPTHPLVEIQSDHGKITSYTCQDILVGVNTVASYLKKIQLTSDRPLKIGLVAQNSAEWIIADIALLMTENIEIPIPLTFSADQAKHLLQNVDLYLVDQKGLQKLQEWLSSTPSDQCPAYYLLEMDLLLTPFKDNPYREFLYYLEDHKQTLCKIIHTPGTTNRPKGVMIRTQELENLLIAMRECNQQGTYRRYLSLAPLSLSIEQVIAVYLTFLDGGTLVFLATDHPLLGEAQATTQQMMSWLPITQPSALALAPSMIESILTQCRKYAKLKASERNKLLFGQECVPFLAYGGAPISAQVFNDLNDFGIPVYKAIQEFGIQLSEIERIENIIAIHSSANIYANYFTVTDRPIRDRIWSMVSSHITECELKPTSLIMIEKPSADISVMV